MNSMFMHELKAQIHHQVSQQGHGKDSELLLKEVSQRPNILILTLRQSNKQVNLLKTFVHHDLVLIKPQTSKSPTPRILGIVDTSAKSFVKVKILFQESSPRHQMFYEMFVLDSVFKVRKISGLSTLGREFVGLDNIRKFVLKACLLDPAKYFEESRLKKNRYLTISREVYEVLKQEFNDSQLRAIKSGLKIEGVTLIQGPPGTGKTKTIMGLLAVLLGSEPKKENKQMLSSKERDRIRKLNKAIVIRIKYH